MIPPLTIVSVFNRYRQAGGEDGVFAAEAALLEQHGHRVVPVVAEPTTASNQRERVQLALQAIWSRDWRRRLAATLRAERPDVVHIHNWFPSMSPAVYYACRDARIPVVQTLHNYRLFCPAAICYRDDRACEDCLGRSVAWPGIRHACYHNSRVQTAGVAAIQTVHRLLGTWQNRVAAYICLTEFARSKLIQAGLPSSRVKVKPNFVQIAPTPGTGAGGFALFVGRPTPEKGILTLLQAWRSIGARLPLRIAGTGPLTDEVRRQAAAITGVEYLGQQTPAQVLALMQAATVLVFPSQWYEGFPLTIAESLACGLPVVAARLGAMESLIEHGRTGRHFTPGDPADLAAQVNWFIEQPAAVAALRRAARAEFEQHYTAKRNYELLLNIYDQVCAV